MPFVVALVAIAVAAFGAWVWRVRYRALRHELEAIRELVAELVAQGNWREAQSRTRESSAGKRADSGGASP